MNCWHPKSIDEIKNLRVCKQDLFKGYKQSFDFALPQQWLNTFADWCKTHRPNVTYDLIRSTVVWSYAQGTWSGPVTACRDVYFAYVAYEIAHA